jgi:murein DD-endopeptidase MepM/ murein hydrolase activator NlpD
MKIKEFFQLIIIRKLRLPIQTFHIFENKNRIRFFIGSLIIIICTAFYQTGTRAQLQPNFPAENKSAVLRTNESIQTSFVNKKENNLNPDASQNIPSIYPVTGRITDAFGSRANPFAEKRREFHPGLDIAAPAGTSVNATADGMVALAGWQSGYGNIRTLA